MNFITLLDEQLSQIRSVLASNTCDKCLFCQRDPFLFLRFPVLQEPYLAVEPMKIHLFYRVVTKRSEFSRLSCFL